MKLEQIKNVVQQIGDTLTTRTECIDYEYTEILIKGLVQRARQEEESDWRMAITFLDSDSRESVIAAYNNIQERLKNTGHYDF